MSDVASPLLITVAPNGARRGKADHEALPLTAKEIAVTAARCRLAGAGMLHLHVRDESGEHSLAPAHYREALREIRKVAGRDLLVQITTEACGTYGVEQQMATVRSLRVEAASFALREFFPGEVVDARVAEFFAWVSGLGIACQFILYTAEEIDRLKALVAKGIIPIARPHALFVLGRHAVSQQSDPRDLNGYVSRWPKGWPWSVCAFGVAELTVAEIAIELGGHVRVGFENNLMDSNGQPLASNEARVAQVARLAAQAGRPLATPQQVRALFEPGTTSGRT
jgi:3-keto-5-aminohexanoate cleavage enzyme